jgi:hypothetical protein
VNTLDADLTQLLAKTLDTSSTNGNAFLNPVLLSRIISEQSRRMPALRNALARDPFKGKTYLWDVETAPGDAYTAADGATLTLVDGKWSQGSVEMSYIYFPTQISNPALIAASELINLLEDRTNKAVKAIMRQEGSMIFNGDSVGAPKTAGLYAALTGAPRFINGGSAGQQFNPGLLDHMSDQMTTDGYDPSEMVYCMSPHLVTAIRAFAFNHFRAINLDAGVNYGFPFTAQIQWNGIPVVGDPYAAANIQVANETMGVVDSKTFTFANPGVVFYASASGTDLAGRPEAAPIVKVSGSIVTTGFSFVTTAAGVQQIAFASAPAATPTVSYTWKQENVYLLSRNKADLVIPESLPVTVDTNLFAPVTQDVIPLRVKQYSSLVVRNTYAHILASNVLAPVGANSLIGA